MAIRHVVEPGQCVLGAAWAHGADDDAAWALSDNEDLARRGRTRDILMPGDVLTLLDPKPKEYSLKTGMRHTIVVKIPKKELHLRLLGLDGRPWANEPYELDLGSGRPPTEGTTDGDGCLREKVRITIRRATLTVREQVIALALGCLCPLPAASSESHAGVANRLRNLGYEPGPGPYEDGDADLAAALALFQEDQGLDVNGELDSATMDALRTAHGS